MPSISGNIWYQWVGYSIVEHDIHTITLYPGNRDITAEAAIAFQRDTGGTDWTEAGISGIVSNGVYESFNPPLPRIQRNNVTQIIFRAASTSGVLARCRYVLNYWGT